MEHSILLSVIIPCFNECDFIGQCLESVISNDYPQDRIEVIVVDGQSTDNTREIISSYQARYPFVKVLDNPERITPRALNIGIKAAVGDIIVRLDAHASYDRNYLSRCLKYLYEYNADNVGGIWEVKPREDTILGNSIALTFAHPFGSGGAYYKTGSINEPTWVDTVPFGCYKKSLFDQIGYFDERLARSQDMEFNKRLRKAGGRILLVPSIKSEYYIRSKLKQYFKHNISDGIWAIYPYRHVPDPVSLRHLVPLLFVASGVFLSVLSLLSKPFRYVLALYIALYSSINLFFSTQIFLKEKNPLLLPYCFISFLTRHFGYGLGSFIALPRTLASYSFWRNRLAKTKFKKE